MLLPLFLPSTTFPDFQDSQCGVCSEHDQQIVDHVLDTDSTFADEVVAAKHSLATGNWYVGDLREYLGKLGQLLELILPVIPVEQVQPRHWFFYCGVAGGFTEPVGAAMLWTASASAVTVAISVATSMRKMLSYIQQLELDTGHFWSVFSRNVD